MTAAPVDARLRGRAPSRYRLWAERVTEATPGGRDRTVDALRAAAITGVVLGHWLVSATVTDPDRPAALHGASPLSTLPALAPVSWLFETLGLFFVAAGYAAARPREATGHGNVRADGRAVLRWLARPSVVRLGVPVLVLAAVWLPGLLVLDLAGAPATTRHLVVSLVTHPLWFLVVYLVLAAAAPPLRRLVCRWGLWSALPAVLAVAAVDAARGGGLPAWVAPVATPIAWSAPYLFGIALAQGRLSRRGGGVLLAGGVAGGALLLRLGYPASAVGVPGDHWSNLDPPSLFALALAAAQLGLFLLVRPWLARLLARPAAWAPVAGLNRAALTVYCWHQSALLLVTFAAVPLGPLPGLLDRPTGSWVVHRLWWLPVFVATLVALCRLFHRPPSRSSARPARDGPARPGAGQESSGRLSGPARDGLARRDQESSGRLSRTSSSA
ncbi:acyltransferase family protein [Actinocatenispora sera]|uniref:Acyltransferase n=1 Tax=Actinocatenispora sera TaxID=390989 RepID=A0A810KYN5_9ACTN|nr:acyltransferase [Actinocatenispora sera]BCJ27542.1 acyltransferase [Actinocatenispora sera]